MSFLEFFLYSGVISANFRFFGKFDRSIDLLTEPKRKGASLWKFSLIALVGKSDFWVELPVSRFCNSFLTLFRMGFFGAAHGSWGVPFWSLLLKICHTYLAMMKLGTVMPYLRKIQKMYKSRDTSLDFCWHQHFFTGNQQILLHQEIQI